MGKFKYTEEEKEINKALKYNQQFSEQVLCDKELKEVRKEADVNINSSEELF